MEPERRGLRHVARRVIALLCRSLGVGAVRSNGLERLAGSWCDEEFRRFEGAVARFERVDDELWR
jgi:hypothetical protein